MGMRKALLDANFILTCVKQKIDFFEFLEHEGIEPWISKEILREISAISNSRDRGLVRKDAELALNIMKNNEFRRVHTGGRTVDAGIIKFAKENPEVIVATLDAEIKRKVKNKKLIIRSKKMLEIVD